VCACVRARVSLPLQSLSPSLLSCFGLLPCKKHGSVQIEEKKRLIVTISLLDNLLGCSPDFSAAAIKGNITPGLIRVLHMFSSPPHSLLGTTSDVCSALEAPIACLNQLLRHETAIPLEIWKPAYKAGIVWVTNLLRLNNETTAHNVLALAVSLLLVTPDGERTPGVGRLPFAVAGLLAARPPVAPAAAAHTLVAMCLRDRHLLVDCDTWGLGDTLKQLAMHSDPETAAGAKNLLLIISKYLDVRPPRPCFMLILLSTPFSPANDFRAVLYVSTQHALWPC
jgi:hypothetical protein